MPARASTNPPQSCHGRWDYFVDRCGHSSLHPSPPSRLLPSFFPLSFITCFSFCFFIFICICHTIYFHLCPSVTLLFLIRYKTDIFLSFPIAPPVITSPSAKRDSYCEGILRLPLQNGVGRGIHCGKYLKLRLMHCHSPRERLGKYRAVNRLMGGLSINFQI